MKKVYKTAFIIIFMLVIALNAVTVGAAGENGGNTAIENNERDHSQENCDKVYLGGMPFGIRLFSSELKVIGFSEIATGSGNVCPAFDAGIRENDTIISINSSPVTSIDDIVKACDMSCGKSISIKCRRDGKELDFSVSPVLSKDENAYKSGMWVKDSTAGIGTVTYVVPGTYAFAGLGHCICDTGNTCTAGHSKGIIYDVNITGVRKGAEGAPGELIGEFSDVMTGSLIANTEEGVFGLFSKIPDDAANSGLITVAKSSEIHEGDAYIRCTLGNGSAEFYKVKVENLDLEEGSNKNFVIEVTDNDLLALTGGIVQGMSGSPVVQDGKLIGAVTHVFVNDPSKGYGIFISQMEESMPDILI
ncbi:MAG: SpoIVB peptidase [Clostridia bacterium]|nr:SpoIVB peptidase [Clostridia bacterium]